MPELPEVETVRRGLEETVVGSRVTQVRVTGRRTVRRQPVREFVALLEGRTLTAIRRRGKYLLIDLDDGAILVVHLRMSGQLRHVDPAEPTEKHTHVVLVLGGGDELRFVDPRTFGELFVAEDLDDDGIPAVLTGIGPDALVPQSANQLRRRLGGRRTALKVFLLDQSGLSGIGNIYADEIRFRARLHPARRTESLTGREMGRLARAIPAILSEAVTLGGSSLRDARYRDLFGGLGGFQDQHTVHARAGLPCPRCARPVERIRIAGRASYFCARCQRLARLPSR